MNDEQLRIVTSVNGSIRLSSQPGRSIDSEEIRRSSATWATAGDGTRRIAPGRRTNSSRSPGRRRARADLRILLLQIRDDPRVRAEEHTSFCDYSGLEASQIAVLNAFDWPDFPPDVADGYNALFIGGASEASVLEPERYPFVGPCIDLTLRCARGGLLPCLPRVSGSSSPCWRSEVASFVTTETSRWARSRSG